MKLSQLNNVPCPVAQAVAIVGDPWTMLILRDAFKGETRFDGFQQASGVSRAILSERLASLVGHGIFERVPGPGHSTRFAYRLTASGRALQPVFMVLADWSETHVSRPMKSLGRRHATCGRRFKPRVHCSECGEPVRAQDVTYDNARASAPAA